jgi:single-stranded DNA-specific DHH superfamily exonuclease
MHEPFGKGNPSPIMPIKKYPFNNFNILGTDNKHIKANSSYRG